MKVMLFWENKERKEALFNCSIEFNELNSFLSLIKIIKFKKPGKIVADVIEENGVYTKYIESGIDLDTLFNINLEYAEDVDEFFDWETYFPDKGNNTKEDDLML